MKILETERLLLREMDSAMDAEFIFELLNTPKFKRYIGDRGVRSAEQAREIIEDRTDPSQPMNRPHIRFDGDRLIELDEKWSHAQNDALGAFLWLAAEMRDQCRWNEQELQLLTDVGLFLGKIQFWKDEDSGHWEEVRKIAASSIGIATAAFELLDQMRNFDECHHGRPLTG